MVADGKASRCEKTHIVELMANYESDKSEEEISQHIIGFVAQVRSDGFKFVLQRACTNARSLGSESLGELVYLCYELADSDSEVDDREKRVIEQIRQQIQRIPGVRTSIKRARQSRLASAENFKSPESFFLRLMVIAIVLAVPIGLAVYTTETSDFAQINVGMSESEVHEIMGAPLRTRATGTNYEGEQNYAHEWKRRHGGEGPDDNLIVHFRNGIVTSKGIRR
jgi:uncharacterized tellurite resistance protein B-like protein